MTAARDRAAFIRSNTRIRPVPAVPEIRTYTADEATELWLKTERELDAGALPPPFWAFPWAGGQALARFILDHPETVRGARVLDVASGSGLVAIAAAMTAAATVEANDVDGFALAAISLNAVLNRVAIVPRGEGLIGTDEGWDTVLAADIFYERDTAAAVTRWLKALAARGARVLVGDPGRTYFDAMGFERIACYDVPVSRALEDADAKRCGVWRAVAAAAH